MSLTHPLPQRPQTTSTTNAQPLIDAQHASLSANEPQSTSTQNLQPTATPPTLPSNTTLTSAQLASPSSYSNKNVLCQACHKVPAKYTCPRCSFKSCSLPCTTGHRTSNNQKQQEVCSGVRDPGDTGGFVPMNEYKYGRFVQDYVFLEEMGRRVSEWGRDIQSKHLSESTSAGNGRRVQMGGGQGPNQRYGGRGVKHGKTKREVLQEKLEEYDIEMMLLPDGMNRRKVNQSTFDNKSNKGFLTIQFRLHRPGSRKAPSISVLSLAKGTNAVKKDKKQSQEENPDTFTLLSHRNELRTPLKDCLSRAFHGRSKKEETPPWIQDLIHIENATTGTTETGTSRTDHDRSATTPPQYQILISGPPTFHKTGINSSTSVKRNFVALNKDAILVDALRTLAFVEFPTLEVVSDKDAEIIITREDSLVAEEEDEWELFDRKRRLDDEEGESGEDGSSGSSMSSSDEDEQDEERAQEARRKRRKIDVEAGKNFVNSLMAYADEESEEDNDNDNDNDDDAANGNGAAPNAASSSRVQPSGSSAAPGKGLGVLQMLDYESDKSSEEEEEGEKDETSNRESTFLAPVSGWGEDREMVDWGDD